MSMRPWMTFCLLATLSAAALGEQEPTPARQLLLERRFEPGSAELDVRVARMVLPKGYSSPLHTHETPGPRYVLKGRVQVEEGGQSRVYGTGEVFWQSGQWTRTENLGEEEAELVVFELVKPK
ncbi:MAG TPA: cupin domain-containing protein [Methylococcus sp.]|nr:cupin domain-containing protein [Methylococcus sp.]